MQTEEIAIHLAKRIAESFELSIGFEIGFCTESQSRRLERSTILVYSKEAMMREAVQNPTVFSKTSDLITCLDELSSETGGLLAQIVHLLVN